MKTQLNSRINISRRRFLTTATTAAAATYLTPRSLFAQEGQQPALVVQGRAAAATAKITTQKLRGNVYVLMGSGGNIAVLPGPDGKLLIDSGISTSQPQLTEALAAISADPGNPALTHLINTHWHYDHTDGNDWVHSAGAAIIAHDNTKVHLSTATTMAAFKATFPPAPAGAIPTLTFADKHTLKLNGATLLLNHYNPAHTDSDISIHFAEADVLHTGDTWFNGFYPFIDYSTGGNIDGMIAAAKRNLATGTQSTIIIPGHGPLGNKSQLSEYLDMLVATRSAVAKIKQQGKSLEETIAAKPTAAYDAKWGQGFMNAPTYTTLVYQGV
jgi:glyoxylase-like metal-dependent hydrolase (beta-lactamase superfamily II)